MKKKYIVLTIVIAIIILFIVLFMFLMNSKNEEMIKLKGYLFFGISYCDKSDFSDSILMFMTDYKCKLCGTEGISSGYTPSLCFNCSKITGRCEKCGKLIKI